MIRSPLNYHIQKETALKYHHLTESERYQIEAGISLGISIKEISLKIKRHRSTVFRELKRNGHISREGYSALYSQQQYSERRENSKPAYRIKGLVKKWVDLRLKLQWSPDQIAGRRKLEYNETIGTETIYRYLLRDKSHGGSLWKNLRHSRSRRKKRYGYHRWPTKIPRTAASERPKVIEDRKRNGDFERDLIVGAARSGYLLTIVDRRSKLLKLASVQNNKAELVHVETVKHLKNINVKSITNDNGCEFAYYLKTAKQLGVPIYFTRPYASWERGTVENTNKLIRQYFPKKTNLKELSHEKIKMVETLLNSRPRKQLGYRTPFECAS